MQYFVTGASGFLGTHLVRQLTAAGHVVRALVYEPGRAATVEACGAEVIVGGFDSPGLREALSGCDGLFHVAGLVSLDRRAREALFAVNVEGVRTVFDAAREAGVARVVHTSSNVTIGASLDGKAIFDEDSQCDLSAIDAPYIDSKHAGEKLALSYQGAMDVVVCNPSGMVGPDDRWSSANGVMFELYLRNRVKIAPEVRNNWCDVRDVAGGHILAMERGRPGERYFLGNVNTCLHDLLARMDEASEETVRKRRTIRWPWTYWIGAVSQIFSRKAPLTASSARFMRYAFWASHEKAARELGYAPRPLETTLRDTLEWYWELVSDHTLARA